MGKMDLDSYLGETNNYFLFIAVILYFDIINLKLNKIYFSRY